MKANELRLGNYVKITGSTVRLDSAMKLAFILEEDGEYTRTAPVPLNQDWLLKLGFERQELFLLYYKKHNQVEFNIFSWETPVGQSNGVPAGEFYMMINGIIHIINSVHQLQNLYFALTREELTIS